MTPNSYALMMFAAGFGTRMKHLTKAVPKPMIKVAGTPLVDHALALARDAQCDPIVANLHYKPDILEDHLNSQSVITLREEPDILETGGGLRHALPLLGTDPVMTMNTDSIWAGPNPLRMLAGRWNPDEMDGLLICVPLTQATGHGGTGDFTLSETGHITRGAGTIYGGVQLIRTELLAEIPETKFSLNLLWDKMLDRNRLYGLAYPGHWCDVGHPAGIDLAEKMLGTAGV